MTRSSQIINYILTKTGLNQKQLAQELDISPSNITEWKSTDIPFDQLIYLEDFAKTKDIISGKYPDELTWNSFGIETNHIERWLQYWEEEVDQAEVIQTNRYEDSFQIGIDALGFITAASLAHIEYPLNPELLSDYDHLTDEDIENIHVLNGEKWAEFFSDFLENLLGHHEYLHRTIFEDCRSFKRKVDNQLYYLDENLIGLAFAKSIHLATELCDATILIPSRHLATMTAKALKKYERCIVDVVRTMRINNVDISEDYFQICNPDIHGQYLSDEVMMHEIIPSMTDYISYGNKIINDQVTEIYKQVQSLEKKVNLLLNHFDIAHQEYPGEKENKYEVKSDLVKKIIKENENQLNRNKGGL